MNKMFYPAIFETEEDGYSVHFPDIEGCNSCGETMDEAYQMATEALGLMISYLRDDKQELPKPSNPTDIEVKENQAIVIIELDYADYLKKHESKAVKKTLTIPSWLNEEATGAGINFSQLLQEALMARLSK